VKIEGEGGGRGRERCRGRGGGKGGVENGEVLRNIIKVEYSCLKR
jgi:hypothetical protein